MRTPFTAGSVFALLWISPCYAVDHAWSYTMDEMYDRATAYKLVVQDKLPKDHPGQLEILLKAHEFKGYVAASLDIAQTTEHQEYQECAKRLPVNTIAIRAASVITSVPLNRTHLAMVGVLTAILYACDEAKWPKPK